MARFKLAGTFSGMDSPSWDWIIQRLVEGETLELVLVPDPVGPTRIEARQWLNPRDDGSMALDASELENYTCSE